MRLRLFIVAAFLAGGYYAQDEYQFRLFICFIANLIVNWEWGFIAVLLWGFSYWFNLSWYPAAAMAVLWLLMGFTLTWMIIWGSSARDNFRPNQQLKNINPYSPKNEDVLPKNKKSD